MEARDERGRWADSARLDSSGIRGCRAAERMPTTPEIHIEAAGVVGLEAIAEMVVRRSQKSRASVTALDARIQHVAGSHFQRGGIERLASVVVQHDYKSPQLVVLERLDHVRGVLDGDRRAFFRDLQVVAAVGIALDALAEQQRDSRIVDPLVVAIPVTVAPKRDLSRLDGIETRSRHYVFT